MLILKKLFEQENHYFPSKYPVVYYGAQNNKVYVVYYNPFETQYWPDRGLEKGFKFTYVEVLNFQYDYETNTHNGILLENAPIEIKGLAQG